MRLALEQLGKDAVLYLSGMMPLPQRVRLHDPRRLSREPPEDASERVVLALDCANVRRLGPDPALVERAPLVVDIDHHHDNSRFGDVNLVVAEASSTGEILHDLFGELGVELITPDIAEALYIALVTDTGRFQYTNTTPKALRLAAELVEAGANVHQVFQDVYENVAFAKLKLLARALEKARVYEGGRMIVSDLERADFAAAGAEEPFSEGIIDYLRAVEGAEIVALIREPPTQNGPKRRVSLRTRAAESTSPRSPARAAAAGTARPPASRARTPPEEIIDFIRREFLRRLRKLPELAPAQVPTEAAPAVGRPPYPGSCWSTSRPGPSSFAVVADAAAALRDEGRARGDARPARHRAPARAPGRAPGSPATSSAWTSATAPRSASASARRPATARERSSRRRRLPASEEILALEGEVELPVPAASAVKIGGERAYALHRRGVAVEMPRARLDHPRAADSSATRRRSSSSTCTSRAGRTCARSPTRSAATAAGSAARRSGPSASRTPTTERVLPLLAALVHLPERRLDDDEAAARPHRPRDSGSGGGAGRALDRRGRARRGRARRGRGIRPETVVG